ncbi:hypothetical protein NHH03_24260 [Stieleria sp. TO1_6]|nr:hypothetical protein [Stieleria tagensis]
MKLTLVQRGGLLAMLVAVNLFLLATAGMTFQLHWLLVCGISATGALFGVARSTDERIVGSLIGSAVAIFVVLGLIMSAFGRMFTS